MTVEEVCSDTVALLRLHVATEADPSALQRLLSYFQNINVVPRRVVAEVGATGTLHVQIDVAGLPEGRLSVISEKIGQVACVLNSYWHRM